MVDEPVAEAVTSPVAEPVAGAAGRGRVGGRRGDALHGPGPQVAGPPAGSAVGGVGDRRGRGVGARPRTVVVGAVELDSALAAAGLADRVRLVANPAWAEGRRARSRVRWLAAADAGARRARRGPGRPAFVAAEAWRRVGRRARPSRSGSPPTTAGAAIRGAPAHRARVATRVPVEPGARRHRGTVPRRARRLDLVTGGTVPGTARGRRIDDRGGSAWT